MVDVFLGVFYTVVSLTIVAMFVYSFENVLRNKKEIKNLKSKIEEIESKLEKK